MSSSVTGSLVCKGKLLVHIAENGRSFDLDCDETALVEEIMRVIESLSGINFNDQIVLYLDMKLESQRPLSAYKLPCDDGEVFIFNKARLQSNSLPPPPERVDIDDVVAPPSPSSSHNPHPLDDASDPATKALPSYERQFRYHYQCGYAIFRRSIMKYEHCERLLREQMVQERAVEVARGNLDQYYRVINQNYGDFMKRYMQQRHMHSDLVVNFGRNVEKLKSCKLHPALQTPACKCLMDFVKEENLQKSVEICTNSHKQFENKVLQFKQAFSGVKQRVEGLLSVKDVLSIKNLEQTINEHQKYINEQKSIMQSLSKDVNTVKKLVDDCVSCQLSSSFRPHDAVSALGPMYYVHVNDHLPRMLTCDQAISKLLDFCKKRKNEMNTFLHNYMQNITYASYLIKDQKLQFPAFKEAMTRQDNLFVDLNLFYGIGPAYRACLAEVVRRKASMKLYMGMAGQMAERLATKREVEVRKREEFLRAHSPYIPGGVLESMGLFDIPNQCEVNITPFDVGLLDIDIADVDRYAPEYLAGVASKLEKHGNFKVSSALSTYSSHSTEAVEIATGSCTRYYSEHEDLLDGSELVEIAGTSRLEVENAKLKAELASRIALICSLYPEVEYESLDDDRVDSILETAAEKTTEALQLKDEYIKHIETMLRMKQKQCISYETRIRELEEKLSDPYFLGQKNSSVNDAAEFALRSGKKNDCKPGFVRGDVHIHCLSTTESMDEISCISSPLGAKLGPFTEHRGKAIDGVDESMLDSSRLQNEQWDSPMVELHHEERQGGKDRNDKIVGQLYMSMTNSSTAESMPSPQDLEPCNSAVPPHLDSKVNGDYLLELQYSLADKTSQLNKTEMKLKSVMEEVPLLRRELEASQNLLDESQMNCAHLENCLHEAREEALTQKSSSDRRASEYSSLRSSVLRMRSLFERLKNCVCSLGGVAGFADPLRALAQSLAKSANDSEDDDTAEFRKCIRVLADKVGILLRQHEELLVKHPKVEATNEKLRKELEDKANQVKALCNKHQQEKQANKEKISFGRLEVHEIAVFVLNASGQYQAITRDCSNYYLSTECVALFADRLPSRPNYIIGLIVHIEHQVVKATPPTSPRPERARADQLISDMGTDRLTLNSGSASNPYSLPVGCDYFVVTVAMLPDRTTHLPAS
ncbi:LOW QUALITY PROTEIN: autophagy-related protein 11-like [Prosopis cineraria]|uniref:LOW QUALITY PROTEIN: autophagy-related protein 11-like n=1 Tax=Prosopis cineraria TaxID=364024 RepID=UPI00240F29BA|nr:LOW QUALITY PROTEIN: autophagy-related protein 11-like [Prosopis cineraria]